MKLRLLGLLGWLFFCFLLLVYIKLLLARSLENFYFHWDAPFWQFLDCLIGAGLITLVKRKFNLLSENSISTTRDFIILISTIPLIACVTTLKGILIIEKLIFGNTHTYYDWVMEYLIDFITLTMTCFSCIAYFYFSDLLKTKDKLLEARRAQSEMELQLLQQKVDPHFLFNSLNVVSALVEQDPHTATRFLDRLAELYRYVLQTQHTEVVPLNEELAFARNYLYLIEQRFGDAYSLDWRIDEKRVNGEMIVPASLQSALENVVKHNAGDTTDPLPVIVEIENGSVRIENAVRPKQTVTMTTGTGLENLVARYRLLTSRPVGIENGGGRFTVTIPLLEVEK